MDEITDLLSQKRLDKYKGVSKEDAVKCHLYNCELAEAFYSSLYYFEIILRNKIDLVFSKYLGEAGLAELWDLITAYADGKIWVGTREEYESIADTIKLGTIVIITDESDVIEPEVEIDNTTSATLGIALLGSMILGQY